MYLFGFLGNLGKVVALLNLVEFRIRLICVFNLYCTGVNAGNTCIVTCRQNGLFKGFFIFYRAGKYNFVSFNFNLQIFGFKSGFVNVVL